MTRLHSGNDGNTLKATKLIRKSRFSASRIFSRRDDPVQFHVLRDDHCIRVFVAIRSNNTAPETVRAMQKLLPTNELKRGELCSVQPLCFFQASYHKKLHEKSVEESHEVKKNTTVLLMLAGSRY
jgi:hypothetical protein